MGNELMVDKERYAAWIRSCRGKTKQKEFGEKIIRFKIEDGRKICATYHRNEVGNWEAGRNLPLNTETFLSIALFSYDSRTQKVPETNAERNNRLDYARKNMLNFLGVNLYCRNLLDALLIQVCRGILSFKDVPAMEEKLEALINEDTAVAMSEREKRFFSLRKETESIRNDLYLVERPEEIRDVVIKYLQFYKTANRVLGERLEEKYRSRQRYPEKMSLESAVCIYAPNNRATYKRIYLGSGITRDWLIDLCMHLRFNRSEINYALENAHMTLLSSALETRESFISDASNETAGTMEYGAQGYTAVGSGTWYQNLEQVQSNGAVPHYEVFRYKPIEERLKVMVLIAAFVTEITSDYLPPVDLILESFTHNDQAKKAMLKLNSLTNNAVYSDEETYISLLTELRADDAFIAWTQYVLSVEDYARQKGKKASLEAYKNEYGQYYRMNLRFAANKKQQEETTKLHYMSALFFTVLTGRYFRGEYRKETRWEIEKQFLQSVTDYYYTYRFLDHVLSIFLSSGIHAEKKRRNRNGRWDEYNLYFICDAAGKPISRMVNDEIIMADLWETILAAK